MGEKRVIYDPSRNLIIAEVMSSDNVALPEGVEVFNGTLEEFRELNPELKTIEEYE